MTNSSHFAPVILYSEDCKAIYDALLSSGNTELADKIREKANRSRLDKMYAEQVIFGSDDEFDHDEEPIVAQGASGAYVMTWRWVQKNDIRQIIREKRNSQLSA